MSILTENSKKMLVESMRECLSEVLHESTSLTSKQATEKIKFITESATYEQLLNITLNPRRQEKYQPAYVLEGAVAILHSACMTGRKHIGVNAITEGALKLKKKTGAVITESMLDAALLAVNEGAGLKVVGKLLNEAFSSTIQNAINMVHANGGLSNLTAIDRSNLLATLQSELGASNATKAWQALESGGDYRTLTNIFRFSRAEKDLQAKLRTATSPIERRQLQKSLNDIQKRFNTSNFTRSGGVSGNNLTKALQNSGAGKTPWGKIALGAAAIGGVGALGYQYYKNRKAMNDDIRNGIE